MAAADTTTEGQRRVRLGVIVGAHGLKGEVRILSHTARPEDVGGYGPLEDAAGRRSFTVEVRGRGKGTVIGRIAGVEDRGAHTHGSPAKPGLRCWLSTNSQIQ